MANTGKTEKLAPDALAVQQLEALVAVPGSLKIITSEVEPSLRLDRKDPRSTAKEDADLSRPDAFVLHDVVGIDGPNHRGQYKAYSDEGDFVIGQPDALLRRLMEWRG